MSKLVLKKEVTGVFVIEVDGKKFHATYAGWNPVKGKHAWNLIPGSCTAGLTKVYTEQLSTEQV